MQGKTRLACRPCTVDPPICLTSCTPVAKDHRARSSGSKCRAAQQPLNLLENAHRPPPSQVREATCLACIALEASGLGNLGRASSAGSQARVSAQARCLTAPARQDSQSTLPLVVHRCASVLWCTPPNDFGIRTPHFAWVCANFPVQFNSHLFLSPIWARTLKMPIPYPPPSVGAYTRTPSHQPLLFGRKGTDHLP